jgi:AbrB family looped-hinge helix DNA binding protein
MKEATLSRKNQVVIPREAREALCVRPGDKLLFVMRGRILIVIPKPRKHSKALRGLAKDLYPPGYLKKERQSWR